MKVQVNYCGKWLQAELKEILPNNAIKADFYIDNGYARVDFFGREFSEGNWSLLW